MLPTNMPLVIGACTRDYESEIVEKTLQNQEIETVGDQVGMNTRLKRNILLLTRVWKLKVWFKEPTLIKTRKTKIRLPDEGIYKCWSIRHQVTTSCHTFNYFYQPDGRNFICYTLARNGTEGYIFPIDKVEKYEVILKRS